jgi:mevalonate kinase
MACKLTGAGGGGCAITLISGAPTSLSALRDDLWYAILPFASPYSLL